MTTTVVLAAAAGAVRGVRTVAKARALLGGEAGNRSGEAAATELVHKVVKVKKKENKTAPGEIALNKFSPLPVFGCLYVDDNAVVAVDKTGHLIAAYCRCCTAELVVVIVVVSV